MRVSWPRFRKAYEEYAEWQALGLWIQAAVESRGGFPRSFLSDLEERCPGFMRSDKDPGKHGLSALQLLSWVHDHKFGYAKRQGWLDALTFYGVRHLRSECAWAYWERSKAEWSKHPQKALPIFDEWWRKAQDTPLCGKTGYGDLGKAVEKYLRWEALALWLSPLLNGKARLPRHILSELKRRFAGSLRSRKPDRRLTDVEDSEAWQRLIRRGKRLCLSRAGRVGEHGFLRRVRSHPLAARLSRYGKHWTREQSRHSTRPYPSFREWRQTADRYLDAGPAGLRKTDFAR